MSQEGTKAIWANSARARAALSLVRELQRRFVAALEGAAAELDAPSAPFRAVAWRRDGGRHGGGERLEAPENGIFGRGSVNVSQVHYEDEPGRRLASATALSTIIHPSHPRAPSVHMHVSWTELRDGEGYWRVMADLNPAIPREDHTERFAAALRAAAPEHYALAAAQGDAYFHIPALGRHRGVTHFYLEGIWDLGPEEGADLGRAVIEAAIDSYADLIVDALAGASAPTQEEREAQLRYHTLYLFQVLTLDRGTTSGLLVHDQNDVGTLGSLPAAVDRGLLASWEDRVAPLQVPLLRGLVEALPDRHPAPIGTGEKAALAQVTRTHYRTHPAALDLQAPTPVPPLGRGHA